MSGFFVEATDPLKLISCRRLANMYVLSPYVWLQDDLFHILIRAVPRRDDEPRLKMAEIWHGQGRDGLTFHMDEGPTLFPGPDEFDLDGCEDPTIVLDQGAVNAWYTGWNQAQQTGRLIHAVGPDPRSLDKQAIAIDSAEPFKNPKEATVVATPDGDWRMFFEYANDEASKIGVASSASLQGPWLTGVSGLHKRAGRWDDWHMSSGPVIDESSNTPVMFYNGATRDAHWRIGWARFDAELKTVVERCDAPLVAPENVADDSTDIAFAASAFRSSDEIWLYYSISDQQVLRARIVDCPSRQVLAK